MQFTVPPDLECLVEKRLSSGAYSDVEDVFRRALEVQDAFESWTEEDHRVITAQIEEGFLQAQQGKLINGEQAREEIDAMKQEWRAVRSSR